MRYQSALVLSTLAAGSAASSGLRHASFHKRHDVKRDAQDVDWANVALDLSGVDWSKVNYDTGASAPAPAPAASSAPAPSPASSEPEVVATPASEPSTSYDTSPAPAESSADPAPAPAASTTPDSGYSTGGGIASGLLEGIESLCSTLGAKVGLNEKEDNGKIWIGEGGQHSATFTNTASKEAMLYCWGTATMWINANVPVISIKLGPGETQKLSVADGFSGGCGAAFDDSDLYMGLLNESILEFTFGSGANGCFDISREINMKGVKLSAKGAKCLSGWDGAKDSCTFICTDSSAARCGAGKDFDIDVGSSTNGPCMVGTDQYTGDPSGGCQMADEGGEHLEVTIHSDRY